jgi:hypothetical protein
VFVSATLLGRSVELRASLSSLTKSRAGSNDLLSCILSWDRGGVITLPSPDSRSRPVFRGNVDNGWVAGVGTPPPEPSVGPSHRSPGGGVPTPATRPARRCRDKRQPNRKRARKLYTIDSPGDARSDQGQFPIRSIGFNGLRLGTAGRMEPGILSRGTITLNRSDLQQLADDRVRDADALLNTDRWSGAYYICGYVVECALKACISKQTNLHDFPDKAVVEKSYTHDLTKLLASNCNSNSIPRPPRIRLWASTGSMSRTGAKRPATSRKRRPKPAGSIRPLPIL